MGKIASKCCRAFEGGNEAGNANLEQHQPVIQNSIVEPDYNKQISIVGEEHLNNNKVKANFQEEMNSFIEKYNCNIF